VITVFGSINLDLIAHVRRLPRPGETVSGAAFASAPGGKGANQALAAARAGARVTLAGAVGDDAMAAEALSLLQPGGVDLQRVSTMSGPTGIALIMVDDSGENVIAVAPGANAKVAPADAARLSFAAGEVLLLQLEVPVDAAQAAATKAREAGAMVVLSFAPFNADALGLLGQATHLVVNEGECAEVTDALGITGDEPLEERARRLAADHALTVIVTLGKDGVLAVADGHAERVPAFPVDVVDTVGAGDTFCGYLAAGLAEGRALGEALELASAAAGLACTKPGAQPAIPERREVEALLLGRPT
jgi:ribokinase